MDRPNERTVRFAVQASQAIVFGQAGDQLEQGWGHHDPDKHTLDGALCDARE